ncbi:MAG: hypothetical protein BIFFINMI_01697 [Phycisphaerae bacterium]|nr:hypothetical protein [Phycisphaerae bacterium]
MTSEPVNPPPGTSRPGIRRGSIESLQRSGHACLLCGRELAEGELLTAVLVELPVARTGGPGTPSADFERMDYCPGCWDSAPWSGAEPLLDEGQSAHPVDRYGAEPVAVWTSRVSPPNRPKRTFVDDRVLTQFFLRLGDSDDPQRLRFRFVLMLILLRHRKLRHVGTQRGGSGEVWKVRLTPAMAGVTATDPEAVHEVVDPQLGEEQVGQVAEQLRQILHDDIDDSEDARPPGEESA